MGIFGTHTLIGSVHNPLMLNFNSVLFCSDLLFLHVTCKSCENIALFLFSMQISLKTTFALEVCTLTNSPDHGPSNRTSIFHITGLSRKHRSYGFSQVSSMLPQIAGQISACYCSSELRNTWLRPFRADQWPHTVVILLFFFTIHKKVRK